LRQLPFYLHRQRLRNGKIVIRVEVDELGLLGALMTSGRITVNELEGRT
jgi:hypothetical protein